MRRRVIENVMQNLKGTAAQGRVSYADLIALGGAYAVLITGGPSIDVSIGRLTVCDAQPFLHQATVQSLVIADDCQANNAVIRLVPVIDLWPANA